MRAEPVARTAESGQCAAVWLPAGEERWQAWLTCDEPPEVAFYGPECAEREFK